MTTSVAVVGASGRLGRVVRDLVRGSDAFRLEAELGSSSSLDEMLAADLIIDVTHPTVSRDVVDFAVRHGRKVLVGSSGWSAERIESLRGTVAAHEGAAVVVIPNFSLGSVLASAFAATASRFFDSIEIVEAHHAGKVDSPSGTAVRTAELISRARAERGPVEAPHVDQRARGQQVASIPVHSLRMTGVVAEQTVLLGGVGESLRITHSTLSSESYEAGIRVALAATRDAVGVTVGLEQLIDLGSSATG